MSKEIKKENKMSKIYIGIIVIIAIFGAVMIFKPNNNTEVEEQKIATQAVPKEEKTIARIDLTTQLVDADEPQFEVYVDGSEEPLKQERWLPNYGSQGYMIQRDTSPQDITIKTLKEIDIKISLRGIWDTDEKEKLLTHKVTYTKATINGIDILEQPQIVWFREPFQYILSVAPGEEYKIHVEWVESDKDK